MGNFEIDSEEAYLVSMSIASEKLIDVSNLSGHVLHKMMSYFG